MLAVLILPCSSCRPSAVVLTVTSYQLLSLKFILQNTKSLILTVTAQRPAPYCLVRQDHNPLINILFATVRSLRDAGCL
jgi:hypothetical protein